MTHEPDIAQFARRIVIMRDGRILLDRPVSNVRDARAELAGRHGGAETAELEATLS